jgi:hypothetical protein
LVAVHEEPWTVSGGVAWPEESLPQATTGPGDAAVGVAVGVADGVAVGVVVGEAVGETVGDTVGETVGDVVGDTVGETVGDTVGEAVGVAVAAAADAMPGVAVGVAVGPAKAAVVRTRGAPRTSARINVQRIADIGRGPPLFNCELRYFALPNAVLTRES